MKTRQKITMPELSRLYHQHHHGDINWLKLKRLFVITFSGWLGRRSWCYYLQATCEPFLKAGQVFSWPELDCRRPQVPFCVVDEVLAEAGFEVNDRELLSRVAQSPSDAQERLLEVLKATEAQIKELS